MLSVQVRFSLLLKALFLLLILAASSEFDVEAQEVPIDNKKDSSFVYDEFPVLFLVEGYGSFYLDVIYSNKGLLYVNVEELFKTLNISCIVGQKR